MANELLPIPLTAKTVHLCIDMQRIFTRDGPWPTPWMDRVLPIVAEIAGRYPQRTVFTRFITPQQPDNMPGMWQRYYSRWRDATREYLDLSLLNLVAPLARLCPPAVVIDKTRYSGFTEPALLAHLQAREAAESEHAPFLDINEIIARHYDELGQEKVNTLFIAGAGPHTSLAGAETNALCVVSALKGLKEDPLAKYFSEKAGGVPPADLSQPAPQPTAELPDKTTKE